MADSYEINLEIQGGEQPALVMETESGATDGASARTAEAWANGTRNGVPVEEGDPAYHNNSKYYRDSAAAIAAGDVIDDDAGRGDTMLAWSADKLVGEFGKKAPAIVVSDTTAEAVKTFSDGADGMPMGVTVGIEPVQDLHGYDNPWPAGGGKNLIDVSGTKTITTQTTIGRATLKAGAYSFSCKIKDNSNIAGSIKVQFGTTPLKVGNFVAGFNGVAKAENFVIETDDTEIDLIIAGSASGYNYTASEFQVESGSTATDYAPYSNICPISGWTGANVTRTGKNLFNKNASGINPGHAININTGNEYNTANYSVSEFIKVTPGSSYVTSGNDGSCGACFYNSAKRRIAGIANLNNGAIAPENAVWIKIDYKTANADTVQLESNTTATAYEPFGTVYPITFPSEAGTVYGGTLTVNEDGTGTLVVDKANIDMGQSANNYIYFNGAFGHTISGCVSNVPLGSPKMPVCEIYESHKSAYLNQLGNMQIMYKPDGTGVYLKDSRYTDGAELKSALNGVHLVYDLATPQVYTISDLEVIETLKGMNNLWANTGDIKAVDYPADTKLFIEKKISELQALILENISNS